MPSSAQYEYARIVSLSPKLYVFLPGRDRQDFSAVTAHNALNSLGSEGWELAGIEDLGLAGNTYWLKRQR